jgi:PEP-CTERM motif
MALAHLVRKLHELTTPRVMVAAEFEEERGRATHRRGMNSRNGWSLLTLALISLPMHAEDITVAPVPEPASIILLGVTIGGLLVLHRKLRK